MTTSTRSSTPSPSSSPSSSATAEPSSDLLAARQRAIEVSGWGNRVPWWQPRNPCLWLYLAMTGYGVYFWVTSIQAGVQIYPAPITVAALIFAAYGVPFWWFTTHIDRYSRQPASVRFAAFLFGGFAATWTIALHANTAMLGLLTKWFGQQFVLEWGAGVTAPVFEELGKGSGVLLLMFIAPMAIRTAYDGFIVGAFVGIGFEILEDILYATNAAPEGFGVDSLGNVFHLAALRLATGFTSHIAYASIFGAGLVYIVGTVAQRRRVGRGLLLCAVAMVLHGTWDAMTALTFGVLPLVFVYLVGFVLIGLLAVVLVFRLTVPDERTAMRAVLAPEVATGVLTEEELDALAGDRRARRRYRRRDGSHADKRVRAHRLEAGHDLADALAEAGGADSERVRFARSELERVSTP